MSDIYGIKDNKCKERLPKIFSFSYNFEGCNAIGANSTLTVSLALKDFIPLELDNLDNYTVIASLSCNDSQFSAPPIFVMGAMLGYAYVYDGEPTKAIIINIQNLMSFDMPLLQSGTKLNVSVIEHV